MITTHEGRWFVFSPLDLFDSAFGESDFDAWNVADQMLQRNSPRHQRRQRVKLRRVARWETEKHTFISINAW